MNLGVPCGYICGIRSRICGVYVLWWCQTDFCIQSLGNSALLIRVFCRACPLQWDTFHKSYLSSHLLSDRYHAQDTLYTTLLVLSPFLNCFYQQFPWETLGPGDGRDRNHIDLIQDWLLLLSSSSSSLKNDPENEAHEKSYRHTTSSAQGQLTFPIQHLYKSSLMKLWGD